MYSQPVGWSCQTLSGEMWEKPGKICSSVHKQLWPSVLPARPIEKSSLYRPEVHFINLVKRIQRIKKKKRNWHKTEDREQMASQAVRPSMQRQQRTGTRWRERLHLRGAGSQTRPEIGGQVWKQMMVYRWKLTSASFLLRWSDLPSSLETLSFVLPGSTSPSMHKNLS